MSVKINTPDVLHESFGEESVIVNLRQGVYYSLGAEGLLLWEQIAKGTNIPNLLELAGKQSAHGTVLTTDSISAFLRHLHAEHLIVIEDKSWPLQAAETGDQSSGLWLQRFEDLHDLLTLDPIHEVDERGWPHARSEAVDPD
jgi:hypothetical protein